MKRPPWRAWAYGGPVAIIGTIIAWQAFAGAGTFVRTDSASAFSWDPGRFLDSRGMCYNGSDAVNFDDSTWVPGRGRYILTLARDRGARAPRLVTRGRLWISHDTVDVVRHALAGTLIGYGGTDADFTTVLGAGRSGQPSGAVLARARPGVVLVRDPRNALPIVSIRIGADSAATLRLHVYQRHGDGFTGLWTVPGDTISGYFCAGWIEV